MDYSVFFLHNYYKKQQQSILLFFPNPVTTTQHHYYLLKFHFTSILSFLQVSDNHKLMVLLPRLRLYNGKDITSSANHLRFVYTEHLKTRVSSLACLCVSGNILVV